MMPLKAHRGRYCIEKNSLNGRHAVAKSRLDAAGDVALLRAF
jgi:hypothetical protein